MGNFVVVNLFIAILLSSFEKGRTDQLEEKQAEKLEQKLLEEAQTAIKGYGARGDAYAYAHVPKSASPPLFSLK